ncbi:unnamed protein product [Notodromas monacha]|uniref:Vesicle transport protein USE1 n=1 Tax=Notodromas monacha TaxID=399045 RepID=A0A7R9BT46_9CRUS|nr:unnamed protein product [Notodromas monacha]CAG0920193.1 unnamed protein product [Notodromas monacha]
MASSSSLSANARRFRMRSLARYDMKFVGIASEPLSLVPGKEKEGKKLAVDADVLKENEKKVKYLRSVCPVYVGAFSSASACDDDDHSPKKLSPLTDSSLVMSSGHFSPRGVQQAPDTPTGRVIESTLRATLEESARRELIGDPFPETGLRNRHNAGMSNDVDAILSAHQAEQDRVAEEMLHLAQSLKEQSQAAKAIICKDKDSFKVVVYFNDSFMRLKTD